MEKNSLNMAGTATLLFSQVLNVCDAVELFNSTRGIGTSQGSVVNDLYEQEWIN